MGDAVERTIFAIMDLIRVEHNLKKVREQRAVEMDAGFVSIAVKANLFLYLAMFELS